jgi:hypothetical protein
MACVLQPLIQREFGVKKFLFICMIAATSCTQSRKGIGGGKEDWIWGSVDFCSNDSFRTNTDGSPDCEGATTHLIGTLHYDANYMDFEIESLPLEPLESLASDEVLSYRVLAKRSNEGHWHLMKVTNYYSGSSEGASENLSLSVPQTLRLSPDVGYIEQYTHWIMERVIEKNGVHVGYGRGLRLLDNEVQYSENSTQ